MLDRCLRFPGTGTTAAAESGLSPSGLSANKPDALNLFLSTPDHG